MMRLITELYFNNIDPNGKGFEQNDDYNHAMQVIGDNEEQLMKVLQGEEKLFSQLMNAVCIEMHTYDSHGLRGMRIKIRMVTNFELGFKLGARFAVEVKATEVSLRWL